MWFIVKEMIPKNYMSVRIFFVCFLSLPGVGNLSFHSNFLKR